MNNMKQAYHDYGFLTLNNEFIGVSLGYNYCAEHECGIKGIKDGMGIKDCTRDNIGIACRTITNSPMDDIQYRKKKEFTYLVYRANASRWMGAKFCDDKLWDYGYDYKSPEYFKTGILTSWSEYGFSIIGMGDEPRKRLKELYENFKTKNIAICFLGTNNPFANDSLSIVIVDRLPKDITDQMIKTDTEYMDLQDIIKKLDLEGKARKAGMNYRHFYAISPYFIEYGVTPKKLEDIKKKKGLNTKYDVIVWVNGPSDQGYGCFTVEDVLEWISHKGTRMIQEWDKLGSKT